MMVGAAHLGPVPRWEGGLEVSWPQSELCPRGKWFYSAPLSPAEQAVAEMEDQAVMEAGARLRFGLAQAPKVWMFIDDWDPPVAATISTRPYTRGADAAAAIAELGLMPASIWATRLLVMWDEWDLRTSLYGEGEYPRGLVAVQATFEGNLLHWYPYTLTVDVPPGAEEVQPIEVLRGIRIRWGQPAAHVDAALPGPIEQIVQRWRRLDGPDPTIVIPQLEAAGYDLTSFAAA
jgi:hypothetical protein